MRGSAAACPGQRHGDINSVLREQCVPALDALYDMLKKQGCLSGARLACRGFRAAVDGSARELQVIVRAADRRTWYAGQLPSLARWPRCTSVTLVYAVEELITATKAAALLALPFSGMSLQDRQRITRLAVRTADICEYTIPDVKVAMALVAQRLPGLRELDFHTLTNLKYHRVAQQLFYDCLHASLPHLERLQLPHWHAIKCAGPLASRLKRLDIHSSTERTFDLNTKVLSSLAQLTALQKLRIFGCDMRDDHRNSHQCALLRPLLHSLPPCMRLLQMSEVLVPDPTAGPEADQSVLLIVNAEFHLDAGKLVSARVQPCTQDKLPLVMLPEHALLACLADWPPVSQQQQQQKGRLRIEDVAVAGAEPLTGPELAALQRVLQANFTEVEMGTLWLGDGASLSAIAQAVELLGKPEGLGTVLMEPLKFRGSQCCIPLGMPRVEQAREEEEGQQLEAPLAADLLKDALMLTGYALEQRREQERQKSNRDAAAAGRRALLVLKGPLVPKLCETPGRLKKWVELMESKAAELAGGVDGSGSRGQTSWQAELEDGDIEVLGIKAYQALPLAESLVLVCSQERAACVAAEALAYARREAAAGALEVELLQLLPWYFSPMCMIFKEILPVLFSTAWRKVARESAGSGGGIIDQRQLDWLLGLREELRKLPDIVVCGLNV